MNNRLFFTCVLILLAVATNAEVFFTRTGKVSFFSHTPLEDIKAENNEVVSFYDSEKSEFRFQVLIKGFRFPKAAMQDHFNSTSYMDSDQFPKADFKGILAAPAAVNISKDGQYNVEVSGAMTIHGVTKNIKVPGVVTIDKGKISIAAKFMVNRIDFGITVPSFTATKIAEQIEVVVACSYEPYKTAG